MITTVISEYWKKEHFSFDVANFLKKKFKTDVEILMFDVILYFSHDKIGNVMLYITRLFVINSILLMYYILLFLGGKVHIRKKKWTESKPENLS